VAWIVEIVSCELNVNSPKLVPMTLFPSVNCWATAGVVLCGTEVCCVTSQGWPVVWFVEIFSCELDVNSPSLFHMELFPLVDCWATSGVVPCGTEVCCVTSHGWPVAWIVEIVSCELDVDSPNLVPMDSFPSVNCWATSGVVSCETEVCCVTSHGWPVPWVVEIVSCELDVKSPNLVPMELFPSVNCWATSGVASCGTEVYCVTSHGWPVAWIVENISCELDVNLLNLIPMKLFPLMNCGQQLVLFHVVRKSAA
jgi:hypothetical protein